MTLGSVSVVGGSLAGLRAVEALRRFGFEGRIDWIGAERHEPYDRPPLSKQVLRGEWGPERIALARGGLEALGAELHFGVRATRLDTEKSRVEIEGGASFAWDGLVIATGGLSIPKIGATDFGYRIARQFGLRLVEPRPALVPLTFDGAAWEPYASLSGLSLPVRIETGAKKERAVFDEDLLFSDLLSSQRAKEEELERRQSHYELLREQLSRERVRVMEHLLPKRFALRGHVQVFPVAVEIRFPRGDAR